MVIFQCSPVFSFLFRTCVSSLQLLDKMKFHGQQREEISKLFGKKHKGPEVERQCREEKRLETLDGCCLSGRFGVNHRRE